MVGLDAPFQPSLLLQPRSRLVILNHGEIVCQGSYDEIRSSAHPQARDLEEVFLRILDEEVQPGSAPREGA